MDPDVPVKPGDMLAGKYHVERVLPPGGMGVVVVATHLELRATVCLKFMLRSVATPDNVERFVREARVAAKLRGAHVCRVMDLARLPDGVPFIVMEMLEGVDLAGYLKRKKRMRPDDAASLIGQACEGLAEAHEAGIVHRDVKPGNLFVTKRRDGAPHLKVLDFGCSKAAFADLAPTRTQAVFGTPAYMSPEQMRSTKKVDARTDVWALGAVLYELLCGRQAFTGESFSEVMASIERAAPAPLDGVPRELAAIVARCLRRDRARRYDHAGELGDALGKFVAAQAPKTIVGVGNTPPARTSRRMDKALDTALATMGRAGATLRDIEAALVHGDFKHTDARALLVWAQKHKGIDFDVDFDGRVRAKTPATKKR